MTGKTDKHILFDVQLNWLTDKKGVLSASDVAGTIHVATPKLFAGEGRLWSPEHLFLSSISSCFMTTYLAFAQKIGFEVSKFECNAIGQIEIVEGRYKFTTVNLYPKVHVGGEAIREKAKIAMEKTNKYCLISNSVNATIFYHSEILIDLPSIKESAADIPQPESTVIDGIHEIF